jgi:hypothetical protein
MGGSDSFHAGVEATREGNGDGSLTEKVKDTVGKLAG